MPNERKTYRPYQPLTSSSEDDDVQSSGTPKRRYIPKPEKLRQDALNSKEGGRMRCDYCTRTFGAYYVYLTVASWPQEARPACRDCITANHLRKV